MASSVLEWSDWHARRREFLVASAMAAATARAGHEGEVSMAESKEWEPQTMEADDAARTRDLDLYALGKVIALAAYLREISRSAEVRGLVTTITESVRAYGDARVERLPIQASIAAMSVSIDLARLADLAGGE